MAHTLSPAHSLSLFALELLSCLAFNLVSFLFILILPPSILLLMIQAKALIASLAEWKSLEVSVRVDRAIVTRLLSRSGRILAGISSNMGITLLVEREKGVLRGRARTEQDAKDANRVLQLKVRCRIDPQVMKNLRTPGTGLRFGRRVESYLGV